MPSRVSSIRMPRSSNSWRIRSDRREIPISARFVALRDQALRSLHRPLHELVPAGGTMASRSSTSENHSRISVRLSSRNWSFVQRDIARRESDRRWLPAPAPYSDRHPDRLRIARAPQQRRPSILRDCTRRPAWPCFSRNRNSLMRSSERCACSRPAMVKFSCLRYCTESSR